MTGRTLDQQLDDGVASGRLTVEDVDAVHMFREFLRDNGRAPSLVGAEGPLTADQAAAARRWLPYMRGDADGPVDDPQEVTR